MKGFLSSHNRIVFLATATLIGLGIIQINWILQARELKEEQIHNQLKKLSDDIAVELEIHEAFNDHYIITQEEPVPTDTVSQIVNSILSKAGITEPAVYAVFQEKADGIFNSDSEKYETELRNSPYKTCISCIITIRYHGDTSGIIIPEMSFIRSPKEMRKLPGSREIEEYLWFSFHIPNRDKLTNRAILGLFLLTVILMILLIGLFAFVLNSLSKQKKLHQVKDDFFNNMTHEFKTPLGSIRLASKTLRKRVTKEKRTSYLDLIENESKKLEGQVDKILQLSAIESGQMNFENEEVNLHEVIPEIIQRLKLVIEQTNANADLELNLNDPVIRGEYSHISNVIYNLVENALKYSGKNPQIIISTFEKNGRKIISVKDFGPGIPKKHQSEIFDRFYRAQMNDHYKGKGFGIGLSYVKSVMESHGGNVILNTEFKGGCEFLISF